MQCLGSVGRWQAVAPWARTLRVGGQMALSWRCSLLIRALQPTRPAHACPLTRSSTLTCTARPRTLTRLLFNYMFCFTCAPCSPARLCQCLFWHFFFMVNTTALLSHYQLEGGLQLSISAAVRPISQLHFSDYGAATVTPLHHCINSSVPHHG